MSALSQDAAAHKKPIRVVVADDHKKMHDLVERMLGADYEVVLGVSNGLELINEVGGADPQLLVVDVSMPLLNGIKAVERLRQAGQQAPAVMLSGVSDPQVVTNALDAGAEGYVLKTRAALDLKPAAEAALKREPFLSEGLKRI